jgi:hypothetical protein
MPPNVGHFHNTRPLFIASTQIVQKEQSCFVFTLTSLGFRQWPSYCILFEASTKAKTRTQGRVQNLGPNIHTFAPQQLWIPSLLHMFYLLVKCC